MKKLFSRIQTRLVNLSIEKPEGHALKRINTLSGLISGMIRKGSSHLPDIGSGLPQNINADSKTIAAKRFVENKWIDFDTHYLPYLSAFLKGVFNLKPKILAQMSSKIAHLSQLLNLQN